MYDLEILLTCYKLSMHFILLTVEKPNSEFVEEKLNFNGLA